jgi:beta-xylosidase
MFPTGALGFVRLFNLPLPNDYQNFWDVPNLLLQKFPASEFTVTTKVTFTPRADHEKAGLIVMGLDYAYLSMQQKAGKLYLSQTICKDADRHTAESESPPVEAKSHTNYLRVSVTKGGICTFGFSTDGIKFTAIGEPFTAREGRWIGAKVGLFAVGTAPTREMGYADVDWFRVQQESSLRNRDL